MKKYNLSQIMKDAWARYRKFNAPYGKNREGKKIIVHAFAECLKRAWAEAKEAVETAIKAAETGLRRMHYSEYKSSYSDCETVEGSYDKRTKTIEVMTNRFKTARTAFVSRLNGLCPRCHTYCYGDCCAR